VILVDETFWGLSTAAWVAVGTIALAVVAGISLVLNGRAGHHAKLAAEAARDAATATRAAVEVEFDCQAMIVQGVPEAWLRIGATRASVWLHALQLDSLLDDTGYNSRVMLPCAFTEGVTPPVFVHAGNAVMFDWPGDRPVGEYKAFVHITYSFEPEGEQFVAGRSAEGRSHRSGKCHRHTVFRAELRATGGARRVATATPTPSLDLLRIPRNAGADRGY
jgi:hypothetical protein